MSIDPSFDREIVVDIDAAVVGVSRGSWIALEEDEASIEHASEIMRRKRFDILPIVTGNDQVKEYFHTGNWNNFDQVFRDTVRHTDVIPSQTTIRDVIRGFAQDNCPFYFLSYEYDIVGLITIVHLNSRQFQIYLFSLLCELEIRLGELIGYNVKEEKILPYLRPRDLKRFEQDKLVGLDVSAIEYAYFPDLFNIINDLHLFDELGYVGDQGTREIKTLKTLRNKVAHPINSVVTNTEPVDDLWNQIDLIENLLFRLRMA